MAEATTGTSPPAASALQRAIDAVSAAAAAMLALKRPERRSLWQRLFSSAGERRSRHRVRRFIGTRPGAAVAPEPARGRTARGDPAPCGGGDRPDGRPDPRAAAHPARGGGAGDDHLQDERTVRGNHESRGTREAAGATAGPVVDTPISARRRRHRVYLRAPVAALLASSAAPMNSPSLTRMELRSPARALGTTRCPITVKCFTRSAYSGSSAA